MRSSAGSTRAVLGTAYPWHFRNAFRRRDASPVLAQAACDQLIGRNMYDVTELTFGRSANLPRMRLFRIWICPLLYPSGMREDVLRLYFTGEASVSQLAKDISGSVVKIGDI